MFRLVVKHGVSAQHTASRHRTAAGFEFARAQRPAGFSAAARRMGKALLAWVSASPPAGQLPAAGPANVHSSLRQGPVILYYLRIQE